MDIADVTQDKIYIAGERRRGRGAEIASHFPADGSLNAVLAGAAQEDVELAIERDFPKAWRIACTIDTGTVWINTYKQFSIATPSGGTEHSGLGREKGRNGIQAWMAQKSLYYDLSGEPPPWARSAL